MEIAQRRLGRQLRILYEQDEPDPIAVLLGATSLAEAIEGLESLSRTARATESVIEQARAARALVTRARTELAARVARTRAARATVAATTAGLEQARSEREFYLADLRDEQELTTAQIASLERRAQQARRRAQLVARQAAARDDTRQAVAAPTTELPVTTTAAAAPAEPPATTTATAPADPTEPPPAPAETMTQGTPAASAPAPPRPGGSMSVFATGYCLRGSTATGLPVGPGIVAVDPTVIPLGTRMTIPGYGEGVAADVGHGIGGARIDLWFASCSQAGTFMQTVTITFD
jgi:cystine transport system substrate-binding protein